MTAVLLLLASLHAQDPVQVRARLADEQIQAGQTTVLRVDVETQGERARIGSFPSLPPGIELQGTRDYDQRQFSIPGGTRRFVSREFVLRARASGRYRIPSVDIVVEGQTYSTRSLLLGVTAAPPPSSAAGAGTSSDGVVLRAWLDADTVYVGEQVTLQAEAMFSQDARFRLRRAPEYEPPTPSGFWVHDLPDRQRPTTRRLGPEVYEVQSFRRAFFPMAPGTYEVPPARLDYEVRRGLLYAPESRQLESDPIPLVVLPVPGNPPESFTGAVGAFELRAWLEPARVPAGEAAVLTVEVEGKGNIKTVPPPGLPEMESIEVFPPSETADPEIRGLDVRGTKRFSWVLIPRRAGELAIPAVEYAYFDPETEAFRTASSAPMTLEVTPGGAAAVSPPEPSLRYLRTTPGAGDPLAFTGTAWFAAAQAVPLLLLALLFGWTRRRDRPDRPLTRRALRGRLRDGLRALESHAADEPTAFFAEADRFAREWLGQRLGRDARAATSEAGLTAAGVTEQTAASVVAVLDRIGAGRYAPVTPDASVRSALVDQLRSALEGVDREAAAPKSRSGLGTSPTAALILLLLVSTAAGAAQSSGTARPGVEEGAEPGTAEPFQAGVVAYDQGRFTAAAEAFRRHVDRHPDDPAGWYNLGNAYHQAGQVGRAAWAWLKVPQLDPRNRDVRHNLRLAHVPPEVVDRVAPPFPLRPSELFLLASVAWFVTATSLAWWAIRGSRPAGTLAAAAFALTILLTGAGWASTREPATLIVLERARLRAGPALRADPVAELEPGAALEPVESRPAWVRVRTGRGVEGWIETTSTGEI